MVLASLLSSFGRVTNSSTWAVIAMGRSQDVGIIAIVVLTGHEQQHMRCHCYGSFQDVGVIAIVVLTGHEQHHVAVIAIGRCGA